MKLPTLGRMNDLVKRPLELVGEATILLPGQTSTGTIEIDIGGLTAASGFDQLSVSGAVNVAGDLNVALVAPFVPTTGNQFLVISSGLPTGTFNAVAGYTVTYESVGVRLTAQ